MASTVGLEGRSGLLHTLPTQCRVGARQFSVYLSLLLLLKPPPPPLDRLDPCPGCMPGTQGGGTRDFEGVAPPPCHTGVLVHLRRLDPIGRPATRDRGEPRSGGGTGTARVQGPTPNPRPEGRAGDDLLLLPCRTHTRGSRLDEVPAAVRASFRFSGGGSAAGHNNKIRITRRTSRPRSGRLASDAHPRSGRARTLVRRKGYAVGDGVRRP